MNEWFILAFFMIVVGIPVIAGIGGDVYKRRLKLRERELEILGNQTAEKAAQYAAQTERLEQRMRVLEQIITDKGFDTATQIEALRQPRLSNRENV
jgi:ABC-type phosphate transport system auxiliary subunit